MHHTVLRRSALGLLCLAAPTAAAAQGAGAETATATPVIYSVFVFMLATFVGLDVIRGVSRLLHTPLMSLTNAVSAIAIVGALLVAGPAWGTGHPFYINLLGLIAVACSMTNIVSGFLITDRMLRMFKPRDTEKKA